MPHRFEPILAYIYASTLWCVGTISTAAAALLEPAAGPAEIVGDEKLRLWCIIGAAGGGLLSATLFAPPRTTGRGYVAKLGTSTLSSILFTPALVHYLGIQPNLDIILGLSAGMALVAVGVIRTLAPLWQKHIIAKFTPGEERGPRE